MDETLKTYLDDQFSSLNRRIDGLAQGQADLTQRVDALESGQREVRVLIEANARGVRSVAESHQILYDGMTRREENLRAEMRELQRLLMVWGEGSNRRLTAMDEIVARLAAAARR